MGGGFKGREKKVRRLVLQTGVRHNRKSMGGLLGEEKKKGCDARRVLLKEEGNHSRKGLGGGASEDLGKGAKGKETFAR